MMVLLPKTSIGLASVRPETLDPTKLKGVSNIKLGMLLQGNKEMMRKNTEYSKTDG